MALPQSQGQCGSTETAHVANLQRLADDHGVLCRLQLKSGMFGQGLALGGTDVPELLVAVPLSKVLSCYIAGCSPEANEASWLQAILSR